MTRRIAGVPGGVQRARRYGAGYRDEAIERLLRVIDTVDGDAPSASDIVTSVELPAAPHTVVSGIESTSGAPWVRYLTAVHSVAPFQVSRIVNSRAHLISILDQLTQAVAKGTPPLDYKVVSYLEDSVYQQYACLQYEGTYEGVQYFHVDHSSAEVSIFTASNDITEARLLSLFAHDCVPPMPQLEDDRVTIRFWHMGSNGPQSARRDINASAWVDTATNYAPAARSALDTLMHRTFQEGDGRIGILHGPPGTGKTSAIRSLARAWKSWAEIEYVIDPEKFFGSAAYMLGVLLNEQGGPRYAYEKSSTPDPWRVVVIEDAEEFLREEAKAMVGQDLARLLNLGDGMIGQGLNVLILMTTNAPLTTLHPAITRAGRCFTEIEVPKLSYSEAQDWCKVHDTSLPTELQSHQGYTIADLYAALRKDPRTQQSFPTERTGQYL